ncbi:DeoR/GlpR family DNA-binding transcription regulator [Crassaminicella profunda]|uniref:DeoR/GlpR family DNA-binding transcription regulator n=1 Tax=Crassaminicella profunda TaxID=1286698 RepID=UPI001CA62EC9|nr:DeoR/GlpR family DNA-binding transcription regulator [Crassaminicella profunda]QZY56272.1 DeoR/GlpR family DNA-binding transcription regulator [Crassaminicella profunda]
MLITEARRKKILELIEREGIVNLQQLTDTFDVSIYTIRRDLTTLEKKGLLKKTHGGAVRVEKSKWIPSIEEGKIEALEEKKKIAQKAVEFVDDGDTIILMGSMVSLLMIPLIKDKNITVVTNSLDVAKDLSQISNIETIMIGGHIKNYKGNILGSRAINDLKNYYFDKAFIPCAGINHTGVSTSTIDSSDFSKAVIESSRQNIIITDYRKIGRITFAHVCDLDKIHILITDDKGNKDEISKIAKKGIHVEIGNISI